MIRFTSSGWQGMISREVTFADIRKASYAVSVHVKENPEYGVSSPEYLESRGKAHPNPPQVVVGFDSRFMSPDFAQEAAGALAAQGIKVLLSNSELPTPALARAVLDRLAAGGLMVTAGDKPADFSGLKWISYWGGAAPQAVTEEIERRSEFAKANTVKILGSGPGLKELWIEGADLKPSYFRSLLRFIDVKAVSRAKIKVAVDAIHGSAKGYLAPFLRDLGADVIEIEDSPDVLFGGRAPRPVPGNLERLSKLVISKKLSLGLAVDGDGGLFGVIDSGGRWLSANTAFGIIFDHLAGRRGLRGKAARTVMTSHFIDAVAKSHGTETREVPSGFGSMGELLRGGKYLMGAEESGGLYLHEHIPDRDGILACALLVEIAAAGKKPLSLIRDDLFKSVGSFHTTSLCVPLPGYAALEALQGRLHAKPPLDVAQASVWRIDETDGFKFVLKDGSWLGLRPQDEGPSLMLYAEASSPKRLEDLVRSGKELIQKK